MKLTKQKLKQIIKEELENIQQEGMGMPSIKQIQSAHAKFSRFLEY